MIRRLMYLDYNNTKVRNITTIMEARYCADFNACSSLDVVALTMMNCMLRLSMIIVKNEAPPKPQPPGLTIQSDVDLHNVETMAKWAAHSCCMCQNTAGQKVISCLKLRILCFQGDHEICP